MSIPYSKTVLQFVQNVTCQAAIVKKKGINCQNDSESEGEADMSKDSP